MSLRLVFGFGEGRDAYQEQQAGTIGRKPPRAKGCFMMSYSIPTWFGCRVYVTHLGMEQNFRRNRGPGVFRIFSLSHHLAWWFGTMEFYDFPFSWECQDPNWRSPSFFRGLVETTNQSLFFLRYLWDSPVTGGASKLDLQWHSWQHLGMSRWGEFERNYIKWW